VPLKNFMKTCSLQINGEEHKFKVMAVDPAFCLHQELKGLLIRDEWKLMLQQAILMYGTYSNLIIIGQPGIGIDFNLSFGHETYLISHQGKTLSLYYVLSVRIAKSQPTLFQVNEEEVWFFNASTSP
jgi:hypothetical protein